MPSVRRALIAIAAASDRWAAQGPLFARRVLLGPVLFGAMVGSGIWAIRNLAILQRLAVNRPAISDVRLGLLHAFLAANAFVLLAAVVWYLRRRRGSAAEPLEIMAELSRLLAPLLSLPFLAMLALPGSERDRPKLTLFFIALVTGLCARGLYAWRPPARRAASRWDRFREVPSRGLTVALLVALCAGYAYFFSRLSIDNHHALHTRALDLGVYDNIFFQSSHGRPLGCSLVRGGNHASAHFDPILVLLSPLYLVHPRAELLLVLQSVWLGAGIVPVYLIARRTLDSRGAGLVFAVIYLLYPALHGANLYDFHSLALVGPLILWLLYFLARGPRWPYFAVLLLTLLCREDVPLLVCFVGLYALADGRPGHVRAGWITIAASVGYFLMIKTWVMPSGDLFNGGPNSYGYAFYFQDLVPNNRGLRDVVSSIITNPAFVIAFALSEPKVLFVLLLFMPLGFLPFLARPGRVMLIYGGIFCLLASDPALYSVHFYYASVVLPVAFALAPEGLRRAAEGPLVTSLGLHHRRLRRALLGACLLAGLLVSWKFGALVENQSFRAATAPITRTLSDAEKETYVWVEGAVRQIPFDATVGVTSRVGAHATNRRSVTFYPRGPLQDWVLLDEAELRSEDLARHQQLVAEGELVEITRRGGLALLRRR